MQTSSHGPLNGAVRASSAPLRVTSSSRVSLPPRVIAAMAPAGISAPLAPAARASLQRALRAATAELRMRMLALESLDKEREKADRAVRAASENAADLELKLVELDEST